MSDAHPTRLSSRHYPGLGFLLICCVYSLLAAFLAWGASEPELDRIWRLYQQLKTGQVQSLTDQQISLFQRTLAEYPPLLGALTGKKTALVSPHRDGWLKTSQAIVIRPAKAEAQQLELKLKPQSRLEFKKAPKRLKIKRYNGFADRWTEQSWFDLPEHTFTLPLSKASAAGEILQLELEPPGLQAQLVIHSPAPEASKTSLKGGI